MRAAAILPIKRFGAAKSRLGELLGPDARAALAEAMLRDVLAALLETRRLDLVLVVSGEPRVAAVVAALGGETRGVRRDAAGLEHDAGRPIAGNADAARAEPAGSRLWLIDDPDEGHSEATVRGVAVAQAAGCDAVALLPGDCPLLAPAELDAALTELGPDTVAVVPDRHGPGTNGLLLRPPDAIEPAFGPGSRERHLSLARAAGVAGRVAELASLALDLDTPDDLDALRAAVAARPERSPATAAAMTTIPGTSEVSASGTAEAGSAGNAGGPPAPGGSSSAAADRAGATCGDARDARR